MSSETAPSNVPSDSRDLPVFFGRYEVPEVLSRDVRGDVLLARDRFLGREVVLHLLRGDDLRGQIALQGMKIAARLAHPNLCPVYDIHEEGDQKGVVLASIKGRTLQELLVEYG